MAGSCKSIWAPGEGDRLDILGDPFTCKAVGKDTDNSWALFEATVMPGSAVPDHSHDGFDESFYILEGQLEMSVGGETVTASPGYFVNVRRGTAHGYRNISPAPARYLTWTHPAGIEHFYEEVSQEVGRFPEDLGKLPAIAARHRIQIAPPEEA